MLNKNSYIITYNGENVISYNDNKTILDYLIYNNIDVQYSCAVGVCDICKCLCLDTNKEILICQEKVNNNLNLKSLY